MPARKPSKKKVGKKASKKARSAPRKQTKPNVKNVMDLLHSDNPADRIYPGIEHKKEVAVIVVSQGMTMAEAGAYIGVSTVTIWRWLQEPMVATALEREQAKIVSEVQAIFGGTIRDAALTLRNILQQGQTVLGTPKHGQLALAVMEKTGNLPVSDEKKRSDKRRAQAVEGLAAVAERLIMDRIVESQAKQMAEKDVTPVAGT